jgi:hypothetical protein
VFNIPSSFVVIALTILQIKVLYSCRL